MTPLRMSSDGRCLAEYSFNALQTLPRFVATIHTDPGIEYERELVSVVIVKKAGRGIEQMQCWADRTTLTLYSQSSGQCLTSTKMRIVGLPKPAKAPARERVRGRGYALRIK